MCQDCSKYSIAAAPRSKLKIDMNIAGPCFGEFYGLVEDAIDNSSFNFLTIEQVLIDTNLRYHDVMHVLSRMKAHGMVTITYTNVIQFTPKMKRAKANANNALFA